MDPDATLAEIRAVLKAAWTRRPDYAVLADMAQRVEDLDGWLSKGGYLPKAWQQACDDPHELRAALMTWDPWFGRCSVCGRDCVEHCYRDAAEAERDRLAAQVERVKALAEDAHRNRASSTLHSTEVLAALAEPCDDPHDDDGNRLTPP